MLVEIKVMGKHLIRVRRARTKNDSVRCWNGVFRGQTDRITGLAWKELKLLEEGFHEFADPQHLRQETRCPRPATNAQATPWRT